MRYGGDSKVLVSVDLDGGVRTWDLTTNKAKIILRETPAPPKGRPAELSPSVIDEMHNALFTRSHGVGVSQTGNCIAMSDGRVVFVWDGAGKLLRKLEFPDDSSRCGPVACSPDGKFMTVGLLKALEPDQNPPTLLVFDVATGRLVYKEADAPYGFTRVVFFPDGESIASSAVFGPLQWRTLKKQDRTTVQGPPEGGIFGPSPTDIAVSSDGKMIAVNWVGRAETLMVWDASGQIRGQWSRKGVPSGSSASTTAVAFLADGKGLVTATPAGVIQVWTLNPKK